MMKKIITISLLLIASHFAFSQEILFSRESDNTFDSTNTGPNRPKYSTVYFGYGFIIGQNETGGMIKMPRSSFINYGLVNKWRLNQYFSFLLDINNSYYYYFLKQEQGKTVPDTLLYDQQSLNFHNLGLGGFLRINYSKRRGNKIGFYTDFGAKADWTFGMRHVTEIKKDGILTQTNQNGYKYFSPINYLAQMKIGINNYALTASYRLTPLFKSSSGYPDLPLISVGFQIGPK